MFLRNTENHNHSNFCPILSYEMSISSQYNALLECRQI